MAPNQRLMLADAQRSDTMRTNGTMRGFKSFRTGLQGFIGRVSAPKMTTLGPVPGGTLDSSEEEDGPIDELEALEGGKPKAAEPSRDPRFKTAVLGSLGVFFMSGLVCLIVAISNWSFELLILSLPAWAFVARFLIEQTIDDETGKVGVKVLARFLTFMELFGHYEFLLDMITDLVLMFAFFRSGHALWGIMSFTIIAFSYAVTSRAALEHLSKSHPRGTPDSKGISELSVLARLFPLGVICYDLILTARSSLELFGRSLPLDPYEYHHFESFFDWYSSSRAAYEALFEAVPQTLLQAYVIVYIFAFNPSDPLMDELNTLEILFSLVLSAREVYGTLIAPALKMGMDPVSYLKALSSGIPKLEDFNRQMRELDLPFIPSGSTWTYLLHNLEHNRSVAVVRAPEPIGVLLVGPDQTWRLDTREPLAKRQLVLAMLARDHNLPRALHISGSERAELSFEYKGPKKGDAAPKGGGASGRRWRFKLRGPLGAEAVQALLRGNTTLETLQLNGSYLYEPGIRSVLEGLVRNRTLTCLDLSRTGVVEGVAGALGRAVSDHKSLKSLLIRRNFLHADGIKRLFSLAARAASLQTITMNDDALLVKPQTVDRLSYLKLTDYDAIAVYVSLASAPAGEKKRQPARLEAGAGPDGVSATGAGALVQGVLASNISHVDLRAGVPIDAEQLGLLVRKLAKGSGAFSLQVASGEGLDALRAEEEPLLSLAKAVRAKRAPVVKVAARSGADLVAELEAHERKVEAERRRLQAEAAAAKAAAQRP